MKRKLLERITRHLAPPARFVALLLAVCAAGSAIATSITPLVVWDGASADYDFSVLTRNGYTLNLNNHNSVADDNSYVQIGSENQKAGITITSENAGAFGSDGAQTVIIICSNLYSDNSNRAILGLINADGHYYARTDLTRGYDNNIKVALANGYNGYHTYMNNGLYGGYSSSFTISGTHVFALTYSSTSGMKGYMDGSIFNEYSNTADSTFTAPDGVAIGGLDLDGSTRVYSQKGMKVSGIAIFDSELSAEEIYSYAWPSAEKYQKWQYADDMVTWTTPTTSDVTDLGGASKFKLFHLGLGVETAIEYTGNNYNEHGSEMFWTTFCHKNEIWRSATQHDPPNYKAPGMALRLTNGYQTTIGGTFEPFTLGGLLVEENATNYELKQDGSSATRGTILGDPTDSSETWFVANASIKFSRYGYMRLCGSVNFDIAENCVVNLNKERGAAYSPVIYSKMSASNANDLTAGGELKMHGSGKIEVVQLTASNSTLDYSDLSLSRQDAYIDGNLIINDATKFKFPAGLAKNTAYTLCSGTLSGCTQSEVEISVGSETFNAKLTFTGNTVSYVPIYTATLSGDASCADVDWTPAITSTSDLAGAILRLTGEGTVTGLDVDPASIDLASGVIFDVTGVDSLVASFCGEGTFRYSSNYPTTVPASLVYQYVGSSDVSNPATISGVTVNGTLKTSGNLSLSSFASTGTFEVVDGTTTVSGSSKALTGAIKVDEEGTLVYSTDVLLAYDGNVVADIYGTLDINGSSVRWLIESANNVLNLYAGSTVKGTGMVNLAKNQGFTVKAHPTDQTKTTVNFQGRLRYNSSNSSSVITVEDGVVLDVSGTVFAHNGNTAGSITKAGAGKMTLDSSCTATGFATTLNLSEGEVDIACAFTGTLAVSATLNLASTASLSGTISGNGRINCATVPASALTFGTWTGIVALPELSGAVNFNNYGISGSWVELTEGMSGWLAVESADGKYGWQPLPNLKLDDTLAITGVSSKYYQYRKISGIGNLTFTTQNKSSDGVHIAEITEDYSGAIVNNMTGDAQTTVEISKLSLPSGTSLSVGDKILKTSGEGPIVVSTVEIGGRAVALTTEQRTDGIYVTKLSSYIDGDEMKVFDTLSTVTIPSSVNSVAFFPTSNQISFQLQDVSANPTVTFKAMVNGVETDISAAFVLKAIDSSTATLTYGLDSAGSVDGVTVEPELAANEAIAVVVASGAPTFAVQTIPGLWYSLLSCDAPTGTFAVEVAKCADSTATSLTALTAPTTVKYYKIGVDVVDPR